MHVAEYAVQSKLTHDPAFTWWVPFVLKKRNHIIAKKKSKYWVKTHKYGIRVPRNVTEEKEYDNKEQNTLWWDVICKEMNNVKIAFEVWEKAVEKIPPGYQEVKCHMIFDVKLGENFRRKARMVAGGHTTTAP